MFRAIHGTTREEFVSLDEKWRVRVDELRQLDHADALLCPECESAVRLKAGEQNRWHFSHKVAAACPLSETDPARIQMRAQLYNWLASKQPRLVLGIEERLQVNGKTQVVDCTVTLNGSVRVGYLALTSGIRDRDPLLRAVAKTYAFCHWVFAADTISYLPAGKFNLNTTHRDVMHASHARIAQGDSLTTLDPITQTLISYRFIRIEHPPQLFRGIKHESPLMEMRVAPRTGELIHPEEVEHFQSGLDPRIQAQNQARAQRVRAQAQVRAQRIQAQAQAQRSQGQSPKVFCQECGVLATRWYKRTGPERCVCEDCVPIEQ